MPANTVTKENNRSITGKVPRETLFSRHLEPFLIEVALLVRFGLLFFKQLFQPAYELKELAKQAYLIGYKSLPLVAITGFIMGLVLPYNRDRHWLSLVPNRGYQLW